MKELGGAPPVAESMNAIAVGSPRFAFRGYAVTGASFAPDGSYIGPLVDTEMSDLGNPVPEHSGGLSVTLRVFRNLSLSAMADFSLGSTIYNRTRKYQTLYNNNGEYNALATQLGVAVDYGIAPVPGVAALPVGSAEYRAAADRFAKLDPLVPGATGFFESGDFLRLREVGIRYDLSDVLRGVFPRTSGRVAIALAARNVALFTDYSGPDIEVNSTGARGLVHGQDFLTLQNPRTYYAMLTIGL
ncbi:MAG: hypothetical protein IPP94_10210 [Ignavibacteria bacterium]|nr:hypothetical protein [Ignavibacteria bacterium]